jgi:tellurite resistance protein TerC
MPDATPVSTWIWFHIFIFTLMAGDYLYVRWQRSRRPAEDTLHSTAVVATILWIAAAMALAVFILWEMGSEAATQYLAGYAIEEALSVDNLFVFLLLFKLFRIEPQNQPRVLFWGVAGAIVMRGLFIGAGIELLSHFEWIGYLFAVVLLIASVRLLVPQDESDEKNTPRWMVWISRLRPVSLRQDVFVVKEDGTRMMTMLLLALIAIEVTDLIFAIDSIPAVLSITRHPFLAYTSNIMAVMGLRSLYFLLAHLLTRLRYLHYGLAAILIFAAAKMLTAHYFKIGALVSLTITVAMLAITVGVSLLVGSPKVQNT